MVNSCGAACTPARSSPFPTHSLINHLSLQPALSCSNLCHRTKMFSTTTKKLYKIKYRPSPPSPAHFALHQAPLSCIPWMRFHSKLTSCSSSVDSKLWEGWGHQWRKKRRSRLHPPEYVQANPAWWHCQGNRLCVLVGWSSFRSFCPACQITPKRTQGKAAGFCQSQLTGKGEWAVETEHPFCSPGITPNSISSSHPGWFQGVIPLLMPHFSFISSKFFILRENNAAPITGHCLAIVTQPPSKAPLSWCYITRAAKKAPRSTNRYSSISRGLCGAHWVRRHIFFSSNYQDSLIKAELFADQGYYWFRLIGPLGSVWTTQRTPTD